MRVDVAEVFRTIEARRAPLRAAIAQRSWIERESYRISPDAPKPTAPKGKNRSRPGLRSAVG